MTIQNYLGNHFPQGRKLTTYEPFVAGNFDTGAGGDNCLGFLISRGGSKNRILATDETGPIYPRLVVLVAAQDSQEQTAHRSVMAMADLLLDPKTPEHAKLADKLLRQFDFLVFPFMCQANVRDGRSRYSYDAPPPGVRFDDESAEHHNEGWIGLSSVGKLALQAAVEDWVSDHPYPQRSVFSLITVHCDVLNVAVNDMVPPLESGNWSLRSSPPHLPTAPYAKLVYPDGPLSQFRQPTGRDGFDAVIHPEYFQPSDDNIVEGSYGSGLPSMAAYGGTEMYFEAPWNTTGTKASHDITQDDAENFAEAWLTGVAVVSSVEDYDGPVSVSASPNVRVVGYHTAESAVQVSTVPEFTARGMKDGRGGVSISASASLSVSGHKEGRGAVTVDGGTVTAQGIKDCAGAVSIASLSAVTVKGTALEVRAGPVSVSATPGLNVSGRKVGRGEAHVAGLSPALTVSGRKEAAGGVAIVAQTSVTVAGHGEAIRPGEVHVAAASAVTVAGTKSTGGPVRIYAYPSVRVNRAAPPTEAPPPVKFRLVNLQPAWAFAERKPAVRLSCRQPFMLVTRRH